MNLIVIAKAPEPGKAKTRLSPPCSPEEAAVIAEAALMDTLDVVSSVRSAQAVIALEGELRSDLHGEMRVVEQRGDGLGARLTAAFSDVGCPAVLIGMDTPQVSRTLLEHAVSELTRPDVDCVFGEATDGGWWIAGFKTFHEGVFDGIEMSTACTASKQRQRFDELGLRVCEMQVFQDVDTFDDAIEVALLVPGSRFAKAVAAVRSAGMEASA